MSGDAWRYSTAIMAHPRRAEQARRLVGQLAGQPCDAEIIFDPDPDGPPTALRTAARAWRHCPPGVSHNLVVQDDATIAPGLADAVATAITQHPQAALALFATSTSWNGAASRVALLAGYDWITSVPDEWFPTVALVMPCAIAHEFADLAERNMQADDLGDDLLLARFLAERGYAGLVRRRIWSSTVSCRASSAMTIRASGDRCASGQYCRVRPAPARPAPARQPAARLARCRPGRTSPTADRCCECRPATAGSAGRPGPGRSI